MIENLMSLKNIAIILTLAVAMWTDLRTRQVPNSLILSAFVIAIAVMLGVDGSVGISPALASIGTMIVFALPLYLLRAIGGGDLKLLFVISMLMNWNTVMVMLLASLIWGSILGLIQSLISGQGKALANNLFALALRNKPSEKVLHKIPFTVAIFFGWLTSISLETAGIKWI